MPTSEDAGHGFQWGSSRRPSGAMCSPGTAQNPLFIAFACNSEVGRGARLGETGFSGWRDTSSKRCARASRRNQAHHIPTFATSPHHHPPEPFRGALSPFKVGLSTSWPVIQWLTTFRTRGQRTSCGFVRRRSRVLTLFADVSSPHRLQNRTVALSATLGQLAYHRPSAARQIVCCHLNTAVGKT